MSEVNMGTLYDINKVAIEKEGALNRPTFLNKIKEVEKYFREKTTTKNHYFMLLCNELKDYTVFNFMSNNFIQAAEDVRECLINRGKVYSIERTEDNIAMEIWIKYEDDDELHCWYLFPYDNGVIEIH